MNARRTSGIVKWFDNKKGYGFILDDKQVEYFVHFTSINGKGFRTLSQDMLVNFLVADEGKGLKAVDVKRTHDHDTGRDSG